MKFNEKTNGRSIIDIKTQIKDLPNKFVVIKKRNGMVISVWKRVFQIHGSDNWFSLKNFKEGYDYFISFGYDDDQPVIEALDSYLFVEDIFNVEFVDIYELEDFKINSIDYTRK